MCIFLGVLRAPLSLPHSPFVILFSVFSARPASFFRVPLFWRAVPIVQRTLHSALPVHLLLRVHLFATASSTFTRASFWQVFCIFRPAVRLFFGVPHVVSAFLFNA